MVPPLERVERREGAERQGGEFVEAYVAKRMKHGGQKMKKGIRQGLGQGHQVRCSSLAERCYAASSRLLAGS